VEVIARFGREVEQLHGRFEVNRGPVCDTLIPQQNLNNDQNQQYIYAELLISHCALIHLRWLVASFLKQIFGDGNSNAVRQSKVA